MHYQTNQLRRSMLNNPYIYQDILDAVETGMSPCIRTSNRHNALYDAKDFNRCMVNACAHGRQVAGCTRSAKKINADRNSNPSEEWMRSMASKTDADHANKCFTNTVSMMLDQLCEMKLIKKYQKLDVAIDMHLIPRYDKKYGEELVRSKAKSGTHVFERYITLQCIVQNRRLVLGIRTMPALENTSDFVRKIVDSAQQAGASIGTVMMDREFFASSVMRTLEDADMKYVVPCKNTDIVVDAIAEFATKKRNRISKLEITGTGGTVSYTIIITERTKIKEKKNGDELLPHEQYIGFATNMPGADPDQYARRWGIETGYRMIEKARAKTHSKNPDARLLCFMYSVLVFNAWVMANAVLRYITRIHSKEPMIPQQDLMDLLLLLTVFDYSRPPEPPPRVLS